MARRSLRFGSDKQKKKSFKFGLCIFFLSSIVNLRVQYHSTNQILRDLPSFLENFGKEGQ